MAFGRVQGSKLVPGKVWRSLVVAVAQLNNMEITVAW
jgi:hypothetical protein